MERTKPRRDHWPGGEVREARTEPPLLDRSGPRPPDLASLQMGEAPPAAVPVYFVCALRQAGNGVSNHGKGLQPRITQLDGRQCGLERVDDDGAGC